MKRIMIVGAVLVGSMACSLAKSEAPKQTPAHLVQKFDKDGDGKLNKTERKALKRMREGRRKWKNSFDTNGDGKLDKKEKKAFKLAKKKRLERFDKDGDGKLNKKERRAFKQAMKKRKLQKSGVNSSPQ